MAFWLGIKQRLGFGVTDKVSRRIRAVSLKARIAERMKQRGEFIPLDPMEMDAGKVDELDAFIGSEIAKHTELSESAFCKLNKIEQLPFLEATAKALEIFKKKGGRPTSEVVTARRERVLEQCRSGVKPGAIAYGLCENADTIYQDIQYLKRCRKI